jgi:hypothetical protein
MTVPANLALHFVVQDNRGFKANVKVSAFDVDVSADGVTVETFYGEVASVITALQAMTNAKVVKAGFGWSFDYAQEPSTETGTYELVVQKAKLLGGDGAGAFMSVEIPAPKDALFLTSADNNLIVVNPTASGITGFQTSLAGFATARGGAPFSQFFGGQLIGAKPRRRRVLQGA